MGFNVVNFCKFLCLGAENNEMNRFYTKEGKTVYPKDTVTHIKATNSFSGKVEKSEVDNKISYIIDGAIQVTQLDSQDYVYIEGNQSVKKTFFWDLRAIACGGVVTAGFLLSFSVILVTSIAKVIFRVPISWKAIASMVAGVVLIVLGRKRGDQATEQKEAWEMGTDKVRNARLAVEKYGYPYVIKEKFNKDALHTDEQRPLYNKWKVQYFNEINLMDGCGYNHYIEQIENFFKNNPYDLNSLRSVKWEIKEESEKQNKEAAVNKFNELENSFTEGQKKTSSFSSELKSKMNDLQWTIINQRDQYIKQLDLAVKKLNEETKYSSIQTQVKTFIEETFKQRLNTLQRWGQDQVKASNEFIMTFKAPIQAFIKAHQGKNLKADIENIQVPKFKQEDPTYDTLPNFSDIKNYKIEEKDKAMWETLLKEFSTQIDNKAGKL